VRGHEPEERARGGTRGSRTSGLPGKLSAEGLAELFEGRTRFVERLAQEPDPLDRAQTLVHELPLDEKREILDAHPAIGQRTGLSARSAAEQGDDADPAVLDELARLNADYEARHGFRFVVFVNRRPKAEILEVLRDRIDNPTDAELETALDELVAIARDRWVRG
jgi:2-oxo-4-hydroxy-4-carboxy--5-ureidoimidazoline (OHCU) decarboxylase